MVSSNLILLILSSAFLLSSALSCSEQWQCSSVTEDYNYVRCIEGNCTCKDGFLGNATADDKCRCSAPNTVTWQNNEALCMQADEPQSPDDPTTCSEQWQCSSLSVDYNYVRCIDGNCTCKDGFLGNATVDDKCRCSAPNTVTWQNNEALCMRADEPQPTNTPTTCSEQWQCLPVSEDYNFVRCVAGNCKCKDGFLGNATSGNKCRCSAPNTVTWQNNQALCIRAELLI
jgi:hypothetical protein